MLIPQRLVLILTATFVLLLVAVLLATAVEIRGPPPKMKAVALAQAAKYGESEREFAAKARLNGTGFDRGDILNGTSIAPPAISPTTTPTTITIGEGLIGDRPTPAPSSTTATITPDSGFIAPDPTSLPHATAPSQLPILALTYTGAGGPKHCRGTLLQHMTFPRPAAQWKEGSCITLPGTARCGVFYAGKDDNCEAHLFSEPGCVNTTMSYVNTVVFMPEERAVGALWKSMLVRCGVDVPEVGMLDPAILGGALKPKKGGAG